MAAPGRDEESSNNQHTGCNADMVKATVLVTAAVLVCAAYFFSEIVDTYRTYSRGEFSM